MRNLPYSLEVVHQSFSGPLHTGIAPQHMKIDEKNKWQLTEVQQFLSGVEKKHLFLYG